jgi:molybdopterin-guanine dinucleotide biosynthesis protein B
MVTAGTPPLLGFVGFSGAGKTTLLVQLLPLLRARGLRVGMLKHAHHDFDIDTPGKDSYALRKAGANEMLVASARRWALMVENDAGTEPQLDVLLHRMDLAALDLILVEGFKHEPIAKIEVYRPRLGKPALYPDDAAIIALATDDTTPPTRAVTALDINNVAQIADFVCARLNSLQQTSTGDNL